MNFIGLDKHNILANSEITEDGYYCYNLGSLVEVTSIKSLNSNKLISSNLTARKTEDKLMVRYVPANEIYFSQAFVESEDDKNFASLYINYDIPRIYIGAPAEFKGTTGVLTLSGFLSANNLVESQRLVFGNDKMVDNLKSRVKVLAVGIKDNELLALYYIPNARGITVGIKGSMNRAISPVTLKTKDCTSYKSFIIDDWFERSKVKVVG